MSCSVVAQCALNKVIIFENELTNKRSLTTNSFGRMTKNTRLPKVLFIWPSEVRGEEGDAIELKRKLINCLFIWPSEVHGGEGDAIELKRKLINCLFIWPSEVQGEDAIEFKPIS